MWKYRFLHWNRFDIETLHGALRLLKDPNKRYLAFLFRLGLECPQKGF